MRHCQDCNKDISHRANNAKRCEECALTSKRRQMRNRNKAVRDQTTYDPAELLSEALDYYLGR